MPRQLTSERARSWRRYKIDVRNGTVTCGESGGHVRFPTERRSRGRAKARIRNSSSSSFTWNSSSGAVRELGHWPFEEPKSSRSGPHQTPSSEP